MRFFCTGIYASFFMETDNKVLKIFSVSDKDSIRISEQHHESKLKKQLSEYGICVDFDSIAHYGLRNISGI